ncbi:MAG: TRAP transporter substrate-binding protein DctP [Mailhella sp.]|nr:TRAP transporter substrate-binding protein DctP [Mailhella sp.]
MFKFLKVLALSACMLAPAFAQGAPIEFKCQVNYGPNHILWKNVLQPWADSFAEKTNGEFTVHLFPGGSIVDINDAPKAIKNGLLDMGAWTPFGNPADNPYSVITCVPGFSKGSYQGGLAGQKWIETQPEAKKELDKIGIPIAFWASAPTCLTSVKEPIRKPEDLKGKRVLVLSGTDANIIEAWGGLPVKIANSDMYVGLQRGMGEVAFGTPPAHRGHKLEEVSKYMTIVPSLGIVMAIVVNREAFEDLPEQYQKMLLDSSAGLTEGLGKGLDGFSEMSVKVFADAGVEIIRLTPEEQAAFDAAQKLDSADGTWAAFFKKQGVKGDVLEYMRKALELSATVNVQ